MTKALPGGGATPTSLLRRSFGRAPADRCIGLHHAALQHGGGGGWKKLRGKAQHLCLCETNAGPIQSGRRAGVCTQTGGISSVRHAPATKLGRRRVRIADLSPFRPAYPRETGGDSGRWAGGSQLRFARDGCRASPRGLVAWQIVRRVNRPDDHGAGLVPSPQHQVCSRCLHGRHAQTVPSTRCHVRYEVPARWSAALDIAHVFPGRPQKRVG